MRHSSAVTASSRIDFGPTFPLPSRNSPRHLLLNRRPRRAPSDGGARVQKIPRSVVRDEGEDIGLVIAENYWSGPKSSHSSAKASNAHQSFVFSCLCVNH